MKMFPLISPRLRNRDLPPTAIRHAAGTRRRGVKRALCKWATGCGSWTGPFVCGFRSTRQTQSKPSRSEYMNNASYRLSTTLDAGPDGDRR